MTEFNVPKIMEDFAKSSHREWSHDRNKTLGASEVGQCLRKVWFGKHQGQSYHTWAQDKDWGENWGAMARGSFYEDNFWEPAMAAGVEALGGQLLYSGENQTTLVDGNLSCTPDGLAVGLEQETFPEVKNFNGQVVLECKTIDPRYAGPLPKPEHEFQLQVQLGMFHTCTEFRPTFGLLTYTDASWFDQIQVFHVDYDPNILAVAHDRATRAIEVRDPFQIPAEGAIAGAKECKYCAYNEACRGVNVREQAKLQNTGNINPAVGAQLRKDVARLDNVKERLGLLEKEKRTIEDGLKRTLSSNSATSYAADDFMLTWTSVRGRAYTDTKALTEAAKEAGVDVDQFIKTGVPSERLTISKRK